MGYTHYWKINEKPTTNEWIKLIENFNAIYIASDAKSVLANGFGDKNTVPSLIDGRIVFNGIEDDAHETFNLERKAVDFDFCKTAEKPYDKFVCAALICAKEAFPDKIEISSDGSWDDWAEARELYETIIGTKPRVALTKR